MKKFFVILLTVVVVLGAAVLVSACGGGSFVDPGHDDINGFGGGGGSSRGKPTKLSEDATLDEMIDKLDEILNYSGTSSVVKMEASALKESLEYMSDFTSSSLTKYIHLINAIIDMI
jgi:hypothetical protein